MRIVHAPGPVVVLLSIVVSFGSIFIFFLKKQNDFSSNLSQTTSLGRLLVIKCFPIYFPFFSFVVKAIDSRNDHLCQKSISKSNQISFSIQPRQKFPCFYFIFVFCVNPTAAKVTDYASGRISYVHVFNRFELVSKLFSFVYLYSTQEIQQAADFLEIPYLSKSIAATIQQTTNQNENIRNYASVSKSAISAFTRRGDTLDFFQRVHLFQFVKKNMEKCINRSTFSDVTFELDDGQMKSHRAMLIARCDMMRAMLNGDFREAHSNVVSIFAFPYIYYFFCSNIEILLNKRCNS